MSEKKPMERMYDALASGYVRSKETLVAARLRKRILMETALALPLGPAPWQVLDAGGGGGLYAAEFARAGHGVTVVDASDSMLEAASQHLTEEGFAARVALHKADICDLRPLGQRQFDLIFSAGDVVSYCPDAQQALLEFARLTRPNGMLLLEVESRFGAVRTGRRGRTFDEIYRTLMEGRAAPPDWPGAGIRLFYPEEFRGLLQQAGWRIVHQWPGSLCWSLLGRERLDEFGATPEGFERLLQMERSMRKIPGLLAAGGDLVFLAAR